MTKKQIKLLSSIAVLIFTSAYSVFSNSNLLTTPRSDAPQSSKLADNPQIKLGSQLASVPAAQSSGGPHLQSSTLPPSSLPGLLGFSSSTLYKVIKVVDGDTIQIELPSGASEQANAKETLRLIGINTPETVDPRRKVECFGKEASARAKELLAGKTVRLESDPTQSERDKYGRLLAYVYLEDGTFFNELMIEEGYAYEYTYDKPYAYQKEFKADQAGARQEGEGLWAKTSCNGIK